MHTPHLSVSRFNYDWITNYGHNFLWKTNFACNLLQASCNSSSLGFPSDLQFCLVKHSASVLYLKRSLQNVCSPILTQSGTSLNFEQFLNSMALIKVFIENFHEARLWDLSRWKLLNKFWWNPLKPVDHRHTTHLKTHCNKLTRILDQALSKCFPVE